MHRELKSILVTSDLSERSEHAVVRALQLGQASGAEVTVLSIVDDAAPKDILGALMERVPSTLQAQIDKAASSIMPKIEVQAGDPAEDILARIESDAPDMVVLGTHRPRTYFDGFRETTAQRIVRNADVSVLVVKNAPETSYRYVLSLMDYSPSALAALQLGALIAPKATIHPAHAVHVPYRGMMGPAEQARKSLESSFINDATTDDTSWRAATELPPSCLPTEIRANSAWRLVSEILSERPVDLIAVGAHGRVGAARALLGSLANELLREPPCDVLVGRP